MIVAVYCLGLMLLGCFTWNVYLAAKHGSQKLWLAFVPNLIGIVLCLCGVYNVVSFLLRNGG